MVQRLPITTTQPFFAFKGFTTQQSDLQMALPLDYKTIHAMVCFDALNLDFRLLILTFAALTRRSPGQRSGTVIVVKERSDTTITVERSWLRVQRIVRH